MNEYRITKYNPAFRDSTGAYTKDEWTSVRDIGRVFSDAELTQHEYDRVEDAYVNAALAFIGEARMPALKVDGLKNNCGQPLAFREGSILPLDQLGDVIRGLLREEFWCRLEGVGGFIHIGWNYYMYVGVSHLCPTARAQTVELGLFVEEFPSPYNESGSTLT